MKRLKVWDRIVGRSALVAGWVFVTAASAWGAAPLGRAFTYQGQLKRGGRPVNDTCDCRFSLWDAATGGGQIGPTLTFDGVDPNPPPIVIVNGLFTVELDFGAGAFDGDARFLEVAVACPSGSGGKFQALGPRQPLTASPYALQTRGLFVDDAGNVGIRNASPDFPLSFGNIIGDVLSLNGTAGPHFGFGIRPNLMQIHTALSSHDIAFGFGSSATGPDFTERVRFKGNGDVGIGTSGPQARLHVVGSGRFDGTVTADSMDISGAGSFGTSGTFGGSLSADTLNVESFANVGQLNAETAFISSNCTVAGRLRADTLAADELPFGDHLNVQWDSTTRQFHYDNSSRRYKENITPLRDDFAVLLEARPVTYTRPGVPVYRLSRLVTG